MWGTVHWLDSISIPRRKARSLSLGTSLQSGKLQDDSAAKCLGFTFQGGTDGRPSCLPGQRACTALQDSHPAGSRSCESWRSAVPCMKSYRILPQLLVVASPREIQTDGCPENKSPGCCWWRGQWCCRDEQHWGLLFRLPASLPLAAFPGVARCPLEKAKGETGIWQSN